MKTGVVITVYNLERFVEAAIESVLSQTRKPDKIVVVNDGSKDRSLTKITAYKDQVVIIDNAVNLGVLPSMISAIRLLDDMDVISFLDGDDIWNANKLDEICNVYSKHPDVMLVTHSYEWIDGSGQPLNVTDVTHKNLSRIVECAGGDITKRDVLLKNSILSYKGVWLGSAFSIKKELLNIEEFNDWSASIWGHSLSHQDQPLAAYMILKYPDKLVYYIHEVLFRYRVFGLNSSGSSTTLDRALFTLDRSKATLLRTFDIVKKMPGRQEALHVQEMKLLEIEYLEALYQRQIRKALRLFFRLWKKLWNSDSRKREFYRLSAVVLFGANTFLRMKSINRKN